VSGVFVTAKLAKIAQINPPLGVKLAPSDPVSFVPMASVSAETARVESTTERPYAEVSKGYTAFLSGDVLVAKITPCFENGKIAQAVLPHPHGFGSTEFHVIRPIAGVSDGRYLHHILRLEQLRTEGQRRMTGSGGQRRVPANFLAEVDVPLPPLPEQRRIAAILDQADTLRNQRRAALAQLDSLTQSLFLDMFGSAEAEKWPMATIADIADEQNGSIRTGPFGSQLLHSEFVSEGVAVLGIDNAVANEFRWGERRFITQAKYRELQRYTVRPGDVLITIMGTCGRCAVVPNDVPVAINTKHLCCITVDQKKCLPLFLHAYFLRHPTARKYLEQTAKGAIMAGLNMGIIKAMPVALPPLPLQQTFATRVQAIEALKAQHRTALAEADTLFASLQQRAFDGSL
jgi:type I restriction enzyme S subunit